MPVTTRPRTRVARFSALVLTLSGLAVPFTATPAAAADPAPGCVEDATTVTCRFAHTGGRQTWNVPAGVTSVVFDLWGAQGSAARYDPTASGGRGAHVTSALTVTPGETLIVLVGGAGRVSRMDRTIPDDGAGYNGGGGAGDDAGGGGGGTDVRTGDGGLEDRVLVAGGGGGSGGPATEGEVSGAGGDGGPSGSAGSTGSPSPSMRILGGSGGEQGLDHRGGSGGHSAMWIPTLPPPPDPLAGGDGSEGTGGLGASFLTGLNGGGGGGGWYGGGGGGTAYFSPECFTSSRADCEMSGAGGGGGGSSYAPGGTVVDGVRTGNGRAEVTYVKPPDTHKPSVTIDQADDQPDPTNGSTVRYAVEFDEPVTGFDATDVVVDGTAPGAAVSGVTGSGSSYRVTVSGMTGSGTVVAAVAAGGTQDATGNTNTASTSTDDTVTVDLTSPTVTIDQFDDQADPTTTANVQFSVRFSEPVTGFDADDVVLGGTAPGAVVSSVLGSGVSWSVVVTGMTGSGTVSATVPAGSAQDGAGNTNPASTSTDSTVTYTAVDTTSPTVTVDQAADQPDPTRVASVRFTVEFAEPVTGFTAQDVSLFGTASGMVVSSVTGSGTTYTVTVTGMTESGTVVAVVPAGAAVDAAGNQSLLATSTDNTVVYLVPDAPRLPQAVWFGTSPPEDPVAGDTYRPQAFGGGSGNPVVLTVAPSSQAVCSTSAGLVSLLRAGTCVLHADQAGNGGFEPGHAEQSFRVREPSTTTVSLTQGAVTAHVTGPGAATPTGTVVFTVDGDQLGTAPLTSSGAGASATLEVVVPAGAAREVRATYAGDDLHAGSVGQTTRTDPVVTAKLSSAKPSKRGWWRTPVTVTFTCTPGSGTPTCPDPVELARNGADQSLTRTVTATDGGSTTITVDDIDIDRTRPRLKVIGVRPKTTYPRPRQIECRATDRLSGVRDCSVATQEKRVNARIIRVSYTAIAEDTAGNTTQRAGWYRYRD